eukprot:scaffold60194_cov67-Phaeocystis_antarctica.AAC.6
MECDDQLHEVVAHELVDRTTRDGEHARVGLLLVREVSVRVMPSLVACAPSVADGVGQRYEQDPPRAQEPVGPGALAKQQPPRELQSRRRSNTLIAMQRTRDQDVGTVRIVRERLVLCQLKHPVHAWPAREQAARQQASASRPPPAHSCERPASTAGDAVLAPCASRRQSHIRIATPNNEPWCALTYTPSPSPSSHAPRGRAPNMHAGQLVEQHGRITYGRGLLDLV